MATTKQERKAAEVALRVTRLNDTRKFINSNGNDWTPIFIKQKKQLAMDLYYFYLRLEKQNKVDDEEPALLRLSQLEKKPKPEPINVPEFADPERRDSE